MPQRFFEITHAATTTNSDPLESCVMDDLSVMEFSEKCQTLGEIDLGSCMVQLVAQPGDEGRRALIIQSSSGHAAVIPTDILGITA